MAHNLPARPRARASYWWASLPVSLSSPGSASPGRRQYSHFPQSPESKKAQPRAGEMAGAATVQMVPSSYPVDGLGRIAGGDPEVGSSLAPPPYPGDSYTVKGEGVPGAATLRSLIFGCCLWLIFLRWPLPLYLRRAQGDRMHISFRDLNYVVRVVLPSSLLHRLFCLAMPCPEFRGRRRLCVPPPHSGLLSLWPSLSVAGGRGQENSVGGLGLLPPWPNGASISRTAPVPCQLSSSGLPLAKALRAPVPSFSGPPLH